MLNKELGVHVAIISHNRPHNVPAMQEKVGAATWYVGGRADEYRAAGAAAVVELEGFGQAINRATDDAHALGLPHLRLDDDLKKCWRFHDKKTVKEISFADCVKLVLDGLLESGFKLGGVAPTNNPFYFNPAKPYSSTTFVIGSFRIALPCKPRNDLRFMFKEDYDLTLQHIKTYGGIHRRNDAVAEFAHFTGAGGADAVRTDAKEAAEVALLKSKWPGLIRDNTRRNKPNEIILNLR